jgi:DNA invertase Pin-like site-specific DNA recombinase
VPTFYPYGRLSRRERVERSEGLDTQADALRAYYDYRLKGRGFDLAEPTEDDGVSGKVPFANRPAGSRLSRDLERGDAIGFSKLDRGFRDTVDCLTTVKAWIARGVEVHILDIQLDTSTPVGQLILGVMALVAEFERERIRERCRDARNRQRRQGYWSGRAPYGFVLEGQKGKKRLVPDPYTRALGKQVVQWRLEGRTLDEIWLHLLTNKIRTVKGGEWSRTAIRRVFIGEMRLLAKEEEERGKAALEIPSPAS